MKKYISPSLEIIELETEDIMQSSPAFTENKDEEGDKVSFIISPESIFGF